MDTQSKQIDDLYTLTLVDGLPTVSEGKTIKYQIVKLRETTVADERIAQRLHHMRLTYHFREISGAVFAGKN